MPLKTRGGGNSHVLGRMPQRKALPVAAATAAVAVSINEDILERPKRGRHLQWSEDAMTDAVNAVRLKSMSEKEAVRTFKVIQFSCNYIVHIYNVMPCHHFM